MSICSLSDNSKEQLGAQAQTFLSRGMQLYKTITSVKSIFLGFSAMVPNSYHAEKVLEHIYFIFYILYNTFQRLILIDTNNKKIYWKSCVLVPQFCNVQLNKVNNENEIFLVIKTIRCWRIKCSMPKNVKLR